MASWLTVGVGTSPRVLDAGAGLGGLSCALLDGWVDKNLPSGSITAYEVDSTLIPLLKDNLSDYPYINSHVLNEDYIEHSVLNQTGVQYTHAILNPPYKKISSVSQHRQLLRQVGIETGNLYSAFVALSVRDLERDGQLVAIIPKCDKEKINIIERIMLLTASVHSKILFHSKILLSPLRDIKVVYSVTVKSVIQLTILTSCSEMFGRDGYISSSP